MGLTVEQQMLADKFAQSLLQKATEAKIDLSLDAALAIGVQFIEEMQAFKKKLSCRDSVLAQTVGGKINWSFGRDKLIQEFANRLHEIFQPVGGLAPKSKSAFWSGRAVQQAKTFGLDFANTIPGFVINAISEYIPGVFSKDSKQVNNRLILDMWAAMSALYAKGTTDDAHVFLVEGETSHQSIFWGSELQELRKRQFSGEVRTIYLHTLTPESAEKYRALSEEVKQLGSDKAQHLEVEITALLKDKENWTCETLDQSSQFKLTTTNLSDPPKMVSYQRVKEIGQTFKGMLLANRLERVTARLDRINQDFNHGEDPRVIVMQLQSLHKEVQQVLMKPRSDKTIALDFPKLQPLIKLSEALAIKIAEVKERLEPPGATEEIPRVDSP